MRSYGSTVRVSIHARQETESRFKLRRLDLGQRFPSRPGYPAARHRRESRGRHPQPARRAPERGAAEAQSNGRTMRAWLCLTRPGAAPMMRWCRVETEGAWIDLRATACRGGNHDNIRIPRCIPPGRPRSLLDSLIRSSSSVSYANMRHAWRGRMKSRSGRTGIGRVMRRVQRTQLRKPAEWYGLRQSGLNLKDGVVELMRESGPGAEWLGCVASGLGAFEDTDHDGGTEGHTPRGVPAGDGQAAWQRQPSLHVDGLLVRQLLRVPRILRHGCRGGAAGAGQAQAAGPQTRSSRPEGQRRRSSQPSRASS